MAATLSVGDVTQLKSGGPKMTVESVGSGQPALISCVWITDDGDLHRENIKVDMLMEPKRPRTPEDKVYPSAPVK